MTKIQKQKSNPINQRGFQRLVLIIIVVIALGIASATIMINKKTNKESLTSGTRKAALPSWGEGYPWGNTDDLVMRDKSIGDSLLHQDLVKWEREDLKDKMLDIKTDKNLYEPGETVRVTGFFNNYEDFPLVNIQLYARIVRKDENETTQKRNGDHIVDQFLIADEFDVAPASRMAVNYALTIPDKAQTGNYYIEIFFASDYKFFYAGHPGFFFNPKTKIISFNVIDGKQGSVFIDKDNVAVNGNLQEINAKNTLVSSREDENIRVTFDIVNNLGEGQEVEIAYNLLNARDGYLRSFSKKEDIRITAEDKATIEAGQKKGFTHEFKATGKYEYILQIIAFSNGQKSILNVPFVVENDYYIGEFRGPFLTKFPVAKGEETTIFTGFMYKRGYIRSEKNGLILSSDTSSIKKEGTVELKLFDQNGDEIGQVIFNGYINNKMRSWQNTLKATHNLNYIKVKGKIYNSSGMVSDEFERVYDCSSFGEETCLKPSFREKFVGSSGYIAIAGFFFVLLSTLLMVLVKGFPQKPSI